MMIVNANTGVTKICQKLFMRPMYWKFQEIDFKHNSFKNISLSKFMATGLCDSCDVFLLQNSFYKNNSAPHEACYKGLTSHRRYFHIFD